ncbi:hypothetical protein 1 [Hubei tombus-like virus 30]|uniref:hypothetical protein 1 n=1 Tax=Hubei tombus-like virus 30 TaxID=1923278 RepID=UPI00090AEE06|nr:hypothetical protein 1 [Hubei tombus-like virus 30]APG76400.1 hypothetical protein 1 [Hubei tombus-like virus 30]
MANSRNNDPATPGLIHKMITYLFSKDEPETIEDDLESITNAAINLVSLQNSLGEIKAGATLSEVTRQEQILEKKNKIIELLEVNDQKNLEPSYEECRAYIENRVTGKLVDNTYLAFCAALARQYLSTRKQVTERSANRIVQTVLQDHLEGIRPKWNYNIYNILKHNDNIGFAENMYLKFGRWVMHIPILSWSLPENAQRPGITGHPFRYLLSILATLALLYICLSGGSSTAHQSTTPAPSITIPNAPPPPLPPLKSDTPPLNSMSTDQNTLSHLLTFGSSIANQVSGAVMSTYHKLTTPQKENTIKELLISLGLVERSQPWYVRLLSWKNIAQASTKLQDSYKQEIHPSILSTVDTLNQLKEPLKQTYTSAKEHTTSAAQKLKDSVANGAGTLSATIPPLMHTSRSKCSSYATSFIENAKDTIRIWNPWRAEPFTTRVRRATVSATKSLGHGCLAMLTLVWETVSSITTYLYTLLDSSVYEGMPLSMETTASSSQTNPSQPTSTSKFFDSLIWKALFFLRSIIFIKLSFAVLGLSTIRTRTRLLCLIPLACVVYMV